MVATRVEPCSGRELLDIRMGIRAWPRPAQLGSTTLHGYVHPETKQGAELRPTVVDFGIATCRFRTVQCCGSRAAATPI